jgi:hypothetical protein
MKKILLYGLVAFGAFQSNAQTVMNQKIHRQDLNPGIIMKDKLTGGQKLVTTRATTLSQNYKFTDAYKEEWMLAAPTTYIRWLSEDSNAVTVYKNEDGSTTNGSNGVHVIGSVFDPKDSSFLAIGQTILTKYNPYTIDTLRWTQFYVRSVDSIDNGGMMQEVVDTLFVQYFDNSGLDFSSYIFTGVESKRFLWAAPKINNYVPKTRLNSAALKTDTIFLTGQYKDSVDFTEGRLFGRTLGTLPNFKSLSTNGTNVTANVTGFTLTFKPMIKPTLGDTFINWADPSWKRKHNGLGIRAMYFENHSQEVTSVYRYNHTFWTISAVADGGSSSIFKSYLPTTNLYTSSTFLDYNIDITVENLSNDKLNNNISAMRIFPNPSSNNSNSIALFELNAPAAVSAKITDLNGRVVSLSSPVQYNKGLNEYIINTNSLSAGIYMVSLESATGIQSAKFIVQ